MSIPKINARGAPQKRETARRTREKTRFSRVVWPLLICAVLALSSTEIAPVHAQSGASPASGASSGASGENDAGSTAAAAGESSLATGSGNTTNARGSVSVGQSRISDASAGNESESAANEIAGGILSNWVAMLGVTALLIGGFFYMTSRMQRKRDEETSKS